MPKDIHPMPPRTPRGGFFLPHFTDTEKGILTDTLSSYYFYLISLFL